MDTSDAPIFTSCLLVEDEPGHVVLIKRHLAGLVENVSIASDIPSAYSKFVSEMPSLVLCDLGLPGGSGTDLIEKMRKHSPETAIVVLTASSTLDNVVAAMLAGAWDYLVKNFTDNFKTRLSLALKQAQKLRSQKARELHLLKERNAFWAAALTASEGLAILDKNRCLAFMNPSFADFASKVLPKALPEISALPLLAILEAISPEVAKKFDLLTLSADSAPLWSTEIQLSENKESLESRVFLLTVTRLSVEQLATKEAPSKWGENTNSEYVVWLQDITDKKQREKFQRNLLSTTVHDLKGPLGAIVTATELMRDPKMRDDKTVDELMLRVASCAKGGLNLIDQLLSATKIQDSLMIIKPTWIELPALLDELISDYGPIAKSKQIRMLFNRASCPNLAFLDQLALKRILGNLLSNAIKFTNTRGSVFVQASANAQTLILEVKDTGSGIDPAYRHQLFERFSRLDKHAQIEGTGLGLYVVKNLVNAHNGTVELSSELNIGSTFTISLPQPLFETPSTC